MSESTKQEKLSFWCYMHPQEAAAEIARLRAQVEQLKPTAERECQRPRSTPEADVVISKMADEIRRLRNQVEGAGARLRQLKDSIDTRINNLLCETKPGCDDSIVGINDAWDVVRKACDEYIAKSEKANV